MNCWIITLILATSYCLNRNNRASSYYWTRRSKLYFLTCFSYFSCYFHTLAFSQNCYLLISLRLFWLHENPISHPVSSSIGTSSKYVVLAPSYFLHRMHGFLKARCSWEPGSSLTTSKFSPFCLFAEGFWCKHPLDWMQIIPFLLTKILKLTLSCVT